MVRSASAQPKRVSNHAERALPAKRTREPDVMLDLGADGAPVGYGTQHASTKRDLIFSIILAAEPQQAAE
jgi:hypothetical protein